MTQALPDDDIIMQPNEAEETNQGIEKPKRKRAEKPEGKSTVNQEDPDNTTPTKSRKKEGQQNRNTASNTIIIRPQIGNPTQLAQPPHTPSLNSQPVQRLLTDRLGQPEEETPSRIISSYIINTPPPQTTTPPPPNTSGNQPPQRSIKERLAEAEESGETNSGGGPSAKDPLEKYTGGEMPKVHVPHPMTPLSNIDLDLIGEWENLTCGKLLAQPFGSYPTKKANHSTLKALIFGAVIEITKSSNAAVSAPLQNPTSKKVPISFLIYDLTENQRQTLLKRAVWSSTSITFRVLPMDPICPDFLFTIKGITSQDNDAIKDAVMRVWNDQESSTFVDALCKSPQEADEYQAKKDITDFLGSVKVIILKMKGPGGIPAPTHRVYTNGSLIKNEKTWSNLRKFLASRKYEIRFQDIGEAFIPSRACGICHGIDHPKGMCPFPKIEGWNGPTNDEEPDLNDNEKRGRDGGASKERNRGKAARLI